MVLYYKLFYLHNYFMIKLFFKIKYLVILMKIDFKYKFNLKPLYEKYFDELLKQN